MDVLLAGLPSRMARRLRSYHLDVGCAGTQHEAMRLLHEPPAPRLLAVSDRLEGAGDVLANVEADAGLAHVLVVVVGNGSALAAALATRGTLVFTARDAPGRIATLATEDVPARARRELLHRIRAHLVLLLQQIDRSTQLVEDTRRMCAEVHDRGQKRRLK